MSAGLDYLKGWADPEPYQPKPRLRPDLCAEHDHPGVTFNPWHDKTWCLCGEVIRDGDVATWAAHPGGPLSGEPR